MGSAALEGRRDVVDLMISRGADLDRADENGRTPLALASIGGDIGVVRALLASGADASARDRCGWTPLHFAAATGRADIVDALADAGADPCARTGDTGDTVLSCAVKRSDRATVCAVAARMDSVPRRIVADSALALVRSLAIDPIVAFVRGTQEKRSPIRTISGHPDIVRVICEIIVPSWTKRRTT